MGAVIRGREIGASIITFDLAWGEALAFACRHRGVDAEVRDPTSLVRDCEVVVLDLEQLSMEPLLAALRHTVHLPQPRVIAVGAPGPSLDGLRVDRFVADAASVDELVDAITSADRVTNRGAAYMAVPDPAVVLTPRECDVLAELLAGRDAEVMAKRLGMSANTARTHVQNVIAKLGVNSRSEAAAWALRAGISPAGQPVRALS
jgi:DNA-binding CsgD family transcriptional regulator